MGPILPVYGRHPSSHGGGSGGGAPASEAAGSVEKNRRLRGNADHAAVSMLVTRSSSVRRPRA
eukprot:11875312-Alexandrium_andersonii.AAC.1